MSLLVIVFFLELALYLVTTVGAKPLNEIVRTRTKPGNPLLTQDSYGSSGAELRSTHRKTSKTRSVCDETLYE